MNCIFCRIIEGTIPSYKLYENDNIMIFLDINPNTNGHMLVIPKKHITDFTEMDNETIQAINEGAKLMHNLIMEKLNPEGIKLVVNYGELQEVKHYHLHLIPYYKNKQTKKTVKEIYNILKGE